MFMGPEYWRFYFHDIFIPQINALRSSLVERTLPSFDKLDEEANRIASDEYERLGSMPADEDSMTDMADLAEAAQEKAINYYIMMFQMKQGLVGLFAVGLYHLFEQQLFNFYNIAFRDRNDGLIIGSDGWKELKSKIQAEIIDLDVFEPYIKLELLRLICNVIKHAEGKAADKLKKLKPEYFMPGKYDINLYVPDDVVIPAELPLAGNDLTIPVDDFTQYCEDVKSFWEMLGEEMLKS